MPIVIPLLLRRVPSFLANYAVCRVVRAQSECNILPSLSSLFLSLVLRCGIKMVTQLSNSKIKNKLIIKLTQIGKVADFTD